jgi:hypothetical protein
MWCILQFVLHTIASVFRHILTSRFCQSLSLCYGGKLCPQVFVVLYLEDTSLCPTLSLHATI